MCDPMHYRWVIYESQNVLTDWSQMSQTWVVHGSQDRLQIGQRLITYVTWNIERDITAINCISVDFSPHWYLYVMNANYEFAALHWHYASVQDTAGHSELKSIDGDFLYLKLIRLNL